MTYRIAGKVATYNIHRELVINFDQLGLPILATNNKTWVKKGTKSVGVLGGGDKRQITAVPVVTAAGQMIGIQLIFGGTTVKCHPIGAAPQGLHYDHSKSHWSTLATMKNLITRVIRLYVDQKKKELRLPPQAKALINLDVWKVHISEAFLEWWRATQPDLEMVFVPAGCTSKGQVCDLVVQKKIKDVVRRRAIGYIATEVMKQLRLRKESGQNAAISVDIRLSVLKPMVISWVKEAFDWFQTEEGVKLIGKGWDKANINKAWDPTFQEKAARYPIFKTTNL